MTKYTTDEEKKLVHLQKCAEYRAKYPDRVRASKEKWRKKNMGSYRAYAKKQRENFPERLKKAWRKWYLKNTAYLNAKKAERIARRKKAVPAWANKFFIEEIYDLAQRRSVLKTGGFPIWHVDHIVPITSPLVCGLHVEHNLRVIPAFDNHSKKNYYWPDMP